MLAETSKQIRNRGLVRKLRSDLETTHRRRLLNSLPGVSQPFRGETQTTVQVGKRGSAYHFSIRTSQFWQPSDVLIEELETRLTLQCGVAAFCPVVTRGTAHSNAKIN